jgi:hypothetical protein
MGLNSAALPLAKKQPILLLDIALAVGTAAVMVV